MERSPLGKLPPELRLCIYEHALTLKGKDQKVIIMSSFEDDDYDDEGNLLDGDPQDTIHYWIQSVIKGTHQHPLALTQTCKAIYHESLYLFYKVNPFYIQSCEFCHAEDHLRDFTELIGPGAVSSLRSIEIEEGVSALCCPPNDHICLYESHSLPTLRKWSLQHPHVALSVVYIYWRWDTLAIVDVKNLDTTFADDDFDDFFERVQEDSDEIRHHVEGWLAILREITVDDKVAWAEELQQLKELEKVEAEKD